MLINIFVQSANYSYQMACQNREWSWKKFYKHFIARVIIKLRPEQLTEIYLVVLVKHKI